VINQWIGRIAIAAAVVNGRALQGDKNHRYVVSNVVATKMRVEGWTDEGIVMCALP
jgi:hypothetical protein